MTKRSVMIKAWDIKKHSRYSFSTCLKKAWHPKRNINFKFAYTLTFLFMCFYMVSLTSSCLYNQNIELLNKQALELKQKDEFVKKALMIIKDINIENFNKSHYVNLVYEESKTLGIDPYICIASAFVESSFNPDSVGLIGERGLYQFRPCTARWLKNEDYYKGIETNIIDSTKMWFEYIAYLIDFHKDTNMNKVLLSYNAGQGRIRNLLDYFNNDISKVRYHIYGRRGWASYDDKVLNYVASFKEMI